MTIFEKIVLGQIPSYKIAETSEFLAFLDAFPLREGHVLVIPKEPIDYIFDLPEKVYVDLNLFAKKVAHAMDLAIDCKRIGVAVIGLEVPHAHIHLVPLDNVGDINFTKPKLSIANERMIEIAESISAQFIKL